MVMVPGVVLVEHPAGGEIEGILVVRDLRRGSIIDGVEYTETARKLIHVQARRSRVIRAGARPMDPLALQPIVVDPAIGRGHTAYLLHDLPGRPPKDMS